jgi:hypothetical protein
MDNKLNRKNINIPKMQVHQDRPALWRASSIPTLLMELRREATQKSRTWGAGRIGDYSPKVVFAQEIRYGGGGGEQSASDCRFSGGGLQI